MSQNATGGRRVYAVAPFILVCSLYAMWGMAHNLNDVLIAQFRRAFDLSIFQASLVQSAFYFAYLVMPLPVAFVMNRYGYRYTVIFGLLIFAAGAMLFWPAGSMASYAFFLIAMFVIACGLVHVETAGVAMITAMGPQASYDWRANMSQTCNPLGSMLGIYAGSQFIFPATELSPAQRAALSAAEQVQYTALQAGAVRTPYLVIAAVLLLIALGMYLMRFPAGVDERHEGGRFKAELAQLIRSKRVLLGVLAQFLYVGAQISCWSFLILYAKSQIVGSTDQSAAIYLIYGLFAFFVGRVITTTALKWVSIDAICIAFGAACVGFSLVAIFIGGMVGVWSLVGVGAMMSALYPGIVSMGLRGQEENFRTGSALMTMAIIGGAIITAITGRVADAVSIQFAYMVPCVCYAAVMLFAVYSRSQPVATVRMQESMA